MSDRTVRYRPGAAADTSVSDNTSARHMVTAPLYYWRRLRLIANHRKRTLNEVVRDALEYYLLHNGQYFSEPDKESKSETD